MAKTGADGETAGTVGQNLGIEGFKIYYLGYGEEPKTEGSVIYQAHVSDVGWQPEVTEGQLAGTVGKNQRVEAVRIKLSGALAEKI